MAVDGAVGHYPIVVIQMVEQLFAGEDLPRLLGEGFQQPELGGSEVQQLVAPGGLKTTFVDNQRALGVQRLQIALRLAAAEDGFYPGDHFPRAVGLADIVVGAYFQPQQTVDLFDFRRHHHHRNIGEAANFPAQRQTVGTGQHQIQQDQMRRRLADVGQDLVAVVNQRRRIAGGLQIINQQLAELRFIFHDKDAWGVFIYRQFSHTSLGKSCSRGNSTLMLTPPKGEWSARRVPPWAATILRQIASPRPEPPLARLRDPSAR